MSLIRLPRALRNTSGPPLPAATSRISNTRRDSGTRCSRFALVRMPGTVHTWSAVSISSYRAPRTSPDRAAVSTRNSNASLTAGNAFDARTFATAEILLRREHRADPAARVAVPVVQRHGVLHDGADALADPPRRRRPFVPDGPQRLDHVGARHLGDGQLAEPGEGEAFHARQPVLAVLGVACSASTTLAGQRQPFWPVERIRGPHVSTVTEI